MSFHSQGSPSVSGADLMNIYKVKKCHYCSEDACPDKAFCKNYHDWKDRRRDPARVYYYPDSCQSLYNIKTKTWIHPSNCPRGETCVYSHSELEQFYHFLNFRTAACQFFVDGNPQSCGWGEICSQGHGEVQIRRPEKATFDADFDRYAHVSDQKSDAAKQQWINQSVDSLSQQMNGISLDAPNHNGPPHAQSTALVTGSLTNANGSSNVIITRLKEELSMVNEEHNLLQKQLKMKEEEVLRNVRSSLEEKSKAKREQRQKERGQLEGIVGKERDKADMLHKRVQCPICVDRDRNAVLVPCGHVFCQQCVSRSETKQHCHICQQRYYHMQMIYL